MTAPDGLWIFNHYSGAPDQPAGTRHFDLARGLVAQGFRVTIFAAALMHNTGTERRLRPRRLFDSEMVDGVRFVWVRTTRYQGNSWTRLLNMLSYAVAVIVVQRRFRRPTVVIGSTVHPFAAAAAYVVARLRGARYFFEIRDLWPQTLVDMGVLRERSLAARVMWWIEAALVRRSEIVVSLLPGTAEYLAKRGLPTDRILYLPNGVRMHPTGPTEPDPRLTHLIDGLRAEGRFLCGYLGAHGRANGLHVILAAAAELQRQGDSRVHILLIGDGPEKESLVASAQTQGLRNLTFVDPVPKASVPSVLSQLDAAILHLTHVDVFRYGISPNKLFDYMANGCPVLFACRSGNDPIQEAQAGISLPPDDPWALASAMRAIADLPSDERRRMGDAGRRYVELHHDLDRLATRLGNAIRATDGLAQVTATPAA